MFCIQWSTGNAQSLLPQVSCILRYAKVRKQCANSSMSHFTLMKFHKPSWNSLSISRQLKILQAGMLIHTSYFPVCRVQCWSKSRTVLLCHIDTKRETKNQNVFTTLTLKIKQFCSLTLVRRSQSAMRVITLWCLSHMSKCNTISGYLQKSWN
jgi:hypothetical protein